MKTLLPPAAALVLAACAQTPPPAPAATGRCSAAGLERFVGQPATAQNGAEMLRQSGAATFRWLLFGRMVTMEYRPDRLGVRLDPHNIIVAATCG